MEGTLSLSFLRLKKGMVIGRIGVCRAWVVVRLAHRLIELVRLDAVAASCLELMKLKVVSSSEARSYSRNDKFVDMGLRDHELEMILEMKFFQEEEEAMMQGNFPEYGIVVAKPGRSRLHDGPRVPPYCTFHVYSTLSLIIFLVHRSFLC